MNAGTKQILVAISLALTLLLSAIGTLLFIGKYAESTISLEDDSVESTPIQQSTPAVLPSDPPPIPSPTANPSTPSSTPASALPTPPIPPDKLPEGDIRLDPNYRKNTLQDIENKRLKQIAQSHSEFFNEVGLSASQANEFAKLLVENELWFFERTTFPRKDNSYPVPPNFEEVAQKRAELINAISQRFGNEVAEEYRRAYPGPGDTSQDFSIP